jgi:hypothetical protein
LTPTPVRVLVAVGALASVDAEGAGGGEFAGSGADVE